MNAMNADNAGNAGDEGFVAGMCMDEEGVIALGF